MKYLISFLLLTVGLIAQQRAIQSVGSIGELRGLNPLRFNSEVYMLGTNGPGTGGAGLFYYAPTRTTPDDGFSIVKPIGHEGRWVMVSSVLTDGDKGNVVVGGGGSNLLLDNGLETSRQFASSATDLFVIGDSFSYGAGATQYTNTWASVYAQSIALSATNLANGSFSVSDANWVAFSGWTVTNATGPSSYVFSSPSTINENQNWSILIGFNDIRTLGTSAGVYRKGLDHLIHWLGIPTSAKRTAQSPDASTGSWTPIPWSNGMGAIGASSSSGTLTWSNVIGSEIYVGYLGWGTNFGGSLQVQVDGVTITNFTTANAAYGNREYINGSDANIPDHNGPYGNGKIDFCPQVVRVTDLGFSAHTVVVTASVNPVYVLWCAGNGWRRTARMGPNVFVGTIPRQSPWTSGGTDAAHAQFNSQVVAAVNAAKSSLLRVAVAQSSSKYDPAIHQSVDLVHPNDSGHSAIAEAFADNFAQDLTSIISGQGVSSGSSGGAGVFTSLNVSGTSTLVGNVTGNGRLLMLPVAQPGGFSHRFGFGGVSATGVQILASDTALDRVLTLSGNSVVANVNSSGAGANLSLGTLHQTVAVQGHATVAQTLGVTGAATFSDRLLVLPTAQIGGYAHRFGQNGGTASGVTLQTGDTTLDRMLTINGNSITATVNSTAAAAGISIGTVGQNLTVAGSETVGSTMTVAGLSTLNDGLTVYKSMSQSSGIQYGEIIQGGINQSGSASQTMLLLDAITSSLGSGNQRFIDAKDDSNSRFYVTLDGRIVTETIQGTTGHLFRGVFSTDSRVLIEPSQNIDRQLAIRGNSIDVTLANGTGSQNLSLNSGGATVIVGGMLQVTTGIELGSGGPTITFGAVAPSSAQPNGSTYHRSAGGPPWFYVREAGAWVGK